ncbi:MAG: LysM peptidoglycan-binding domain-containing M23 family metallopeptidase [Roseiarcus sp.]|jgi:murein DD-endopeptidase MepM/ murein hydrolase activator NlpD
MSKLAALVVRRSVARAALTGLVGIWLSGCSADSTRLSETFNSPLSNPFSTASNDAAAPVAPKADYAGAAHPSPVAVAALSPAAPATTGQIKSPANQPVTGFGAGWSVVGGSPIVVADGESLDSLSRRYGVPASAMLKTNGLSSAAQVHGGMRLVVPVYNANGAAVAAAPVEKAKRVASADAPDPAPVKRAKAKKTHAAAVAEASPPPAKSAAKTAAPVVVAQTDGDAKATAAKKKPTADAAPISDVHASDPAPAPPLTGAQADAAGVAPEFRWPARGRIIESFKAGGNDGINIAVPEGTSVRAAESGVVAYAGSELKGYGNLVLIRHPNGFVTAYANNGELDVKRGDTVKRGQIIAKSGQSGNVNSPQLHFELRKGSTPVDPTSYLAGL